MPVIKKQTPTQPNPINGLSAPTGSVLSEVIDVRDLQSDYLRLVVYGRNRVGKSHLACKFRKPLLLVSFEPAMSGGATTVKLEQGIKFIHIVARGKRDHRGKVSTEEAKDKAVRLAVELQGNCPFATVVLDTITSLQDVILQQIVARDEVIDQLNWGEITEAQYRERSDDLRKALRPWMSLQSDLIFLAQEKDHNPPKDRTKSKLLRGLQHESFFAEDIGGATAKWLHDSCDYITQLYLDKEWKKVLKPGVLGKPGRWVDEPTGRQVRRLRCMYHVNYAAGFRSPNPDLVPEYIDNPTAEKVYAVIRGERVDGAYYPEEQEEEQAETSV
jgi:hypothetical protein